ncbi:MAG TPA: hypothetical protein VN881_14080 [Candidatus Acidoferrales bacterium]|nr:hypothetical protein [Candidatus Acidoferrales bacterium]
MKTCRLFVSPKGSIGILPSVLAIAIFAGSLLVCGSGTQTGGTPPAAKTTQVVVMLTSTANDQLVPTTH